LEDSMTREQGSAKQPPAVDTYSDVELREIIGEAAREPDEAEARTFTGDQVRAAAAEVGIDAEAVERALAARRAKVGERLRDATLQVTAPAKERGEIFVDSSREKSTANPAAYEGLRRARLPYLPMALVSLGLCGLMRLFASSAVKPTGGALEPLRAAYADILTGRLPEIFCLAALGTAFMSFVAWRFEDRQ
jgi:hypothetical protein